MEDIFEFESYAICVNCDEIYDKKEAELYQELRKITKTCFGNDNWCKNCDLRKISRIHIR